MEVVPPQPIWRTTPGEVRLPVDLLDALEQKAAAQNRSHQRLIKSWLEERLQAEVERATAPGSIDEPASTQTA